MVVQAKDSYDVMLLPGDGIGPEITAATVNALEPLQSLFKLNFKEVGCLLMRGRKRASEGAPCARAWTKSVPLSIVRTRQRFCL